MYKIQHFQINAYYQNLFKPIMQIYIKNNYYFYKNDDKNNNAASLLQSPSYIIELYMAHI